MIRSVDFTLFVLIIQMVENDIMWDFILLLIVALRIDWDKNLLIYNFYCFKFSGTWFLIDIFILDV